MALETIKNCRSCDSPNIEKFLDLGRQPFANALLKSNRDEEKKYPLTLSFCHACSLVQLNETADPMELFSNYIWVTGTSAVANRYAQAFCRHVLDCVEQTSQQTFVLEAASNDGTFLKEFSKRNCKVLGVEPAANIAAMANARGVQTESAFFGNQTAKNIIGKQGPAQVVIARNVLPHVANLHDFMRGLKIMTAPDGWLVLEVHHAQAILQELHYDSVYHEHLCYFSLQSLKKLLEQYGFQIGKVLSSPISGGSIVVFAQKNLKEVGRSVDHYERDEVKTETNTVTSWRKFAQQTLLHRERLLSLLEGETRQGKKIVGYGASARSSTLLNFCGIDRRYLAMIADQNLLKRNLFTPGSHIPIQDPATVMAMNPDTVLVLAWNFFEEIQTILRGSYHFSGALIKPLPREPIYGTNEAR